MRSLVRVLLALVPIQCQRASPIRGVVKKEALFSANSSIVIQQGCDKDTAMKQLESVPPNYETAQLWNSMADSGPGQGGPPGRSCSRQTALLCSGPAGPFCPAALRLSSLLWWEVLDVSIPAGKQLSIFDQKKMWTSLAIGKMSYRPMSPIQSPICLSSCK